MSQADLHVQGSYRERSIVHVCPNMYNMSSALQFCPSIVHAG